MSGAASELLAALREALEALDIGDCHSGGDYHSSAVGRHTDADGGRLTCPACRARAAIAKYTDRN